MKSAVLLVGNFLSRHGASRTMGEELAVRLAAAGWSVTTTSDRRAPLPRLLDMQRTIYRAGPFAVAQIDVYSGAAFLWAEAAGWSLGRRGIPYVLTLHGGRLPEFARRWPRRVRRLLAAARAVTAPSRFLQKAMLPWRGDLHLLPNAIDLAAYPAARRCHVRPRLVWLRAFHRIYAPELAPRVLARLVDDFPDATLHMIGPDKGDGSLERTRERARELGVSKRLTITPGVAKADVPRHLAGGDIFLNTSTVDNAPVSVTEAMACGLCVVSTEAGGLRDLIDDGASGLLVPAHAPREMAGAVRRLLLEPALAQRLSAGGRRAAEGLDWSRLLPRWEDVLRSSARSKAV